MTGLPLLLDQNSVGRSKVTLLKAENVSVLVSNGSISLFLYLWHYMGESFTFCSDFHFQWFALTLVQWPDSAVVSCVMLDFRIQLSVKRQSFPAGLSFLLRTYRL